MFWVVFLIFQSCSQRDAVQIKQATPEHDPGQWPQSSSPWSGTSPQPTPQLSPLLALANALLLCRSLYG